MVGSDLLCLMSLSIYATQITNLKQCLQGKYFIPPQSARQDGNFAHLRFFNSKLLSAKFGLFDTEFLRIVTQKKVWKFKTGVLK